MKERLLGGVGYAFGDLLGDIGAWLLLGIAVAGVISYLVPADFFAHYLGGEFSSLLIMLFVGIPLYICASASTPVAAAMVLKGLSPGAALVFLLAGPATNAATLAVVSRFWGRRTTLLYLSSIACCSLVLGWLVNRLYAWARIDILQWIHYSGEEPASPLSIGSALLLILLMLRCWWPRKR